MTSDAALPIRTYELPWSLETEQDQKFRRTLRNCALTLAGLTLLLSLLPAPERDLAELREVPPRFASLITEREIPPPAVEAEPEPEPEPVVDEPEPAPEALADGPPEEPAPIEEPVPDPVVPEEPIVEPAPVDRTQLARERASVAGLLPLAASLASLRDDSNLERLDRAEVGAAGDPEASAPERSLITSNVGSDSGGIDIGELSRDTGGSGLGTRATTRVSSPVGGDGTGGGGTGTGAGVPGGRGQAGGAGSSGSRSRAEIERVFDRNKGAIYALYNRALRQNPLLEGKLVLRLTIEPDGTVSFCEVVSSELDDPDLERRLVQRVLLFQFEPRDVEPVTTTKPIDFFPA